MGRKVGKGAGLTLQNVFVLRGASMGKSVFIGWLPPWGGGSSVTLSS